VEVGLLISEKLLKLREKINLSQEEIAQRLGIARTTYASYEQGKREPDIEMLRKISTFHGIEPGDLIGGTKKEGSRPSKVDEAVRRIENELGVVLSDDPIIMKGLENYLRMAGELKKSSE
jgi:transcriptional regulator with XRE-family HTH domain